MIDLYYYYEYSTETISYYYRRTKSKLNTFYYEYVHQRVCQAPVLNI